MITGKRISQDARTVRKRELNFFNGRDHRFQVVCVKLQTKKENQNKVWGLNTLNIDYGKNIQSRMSFNWRCWQSFVAVVTKKSTNSTLRF
jgi:hypothetical protein